MRYICALLEADIVGQITHRLAMKVYRSYAPAYHTLPAELYSVRSGDCLAATSKLLKIVKLND
ncbi:hypothetical protein [Xenorhabdus szentirmaii]|uniref:Uncharacterized protein n=1 Tax=Xenorhabdus szentirmaii TaxID=290112 RepID=A0AAW3YVW7_9GAMM|nr:MULTISPECIES: hypothetical protein [Xenorhabdus]MBD2794222.1 hypothetical protein [Xenorhabdus sp. CUL]MBD2801451.1 hypothetical protein [Xenorhabdus sp. M]MBD2805187.1 hypothetical protein [Xenorhabdus sp. ZM]